MDDLFFYIAKLFWLLASPDSLFVLLLVTAVLLYVAGRKVVARRLFAFLTGCVLALSLLPVGDWLLHPLESAFPPNPELPDEIDGIVVLGGSVNPRMSEAWGQFEVKESAERIEYFAALARRYPEARLIITGGDASLQQHGPTEAATLRVHLDIFGIDTARVEFDEQARNTAENALYTRLLARPQPGSNWVLITTAFHMPRAIGAFCRLDWSLIPYPVDHRTDPARLVRPGFDLIGHAARLNIALYAWAGLVAYRLSGKIPALVPKGC